MKPYVGVTAFMSREQVLEALDNMPQESSHLLMVGLLASSKTLRGETNKYPNRFPIIGELPLIAPLDADPRELRLIHFSTGDEGQGQLTSSMRQIRDILGWRGFVHGFQLNMVWPNAKAIKDGSRLGDRIVLQIGPRAMRVGGGYTETAKRVADYGDAITDVLVDGSGGKGVPLDTDLCLRYLEAIAERSPNIGLGVAGGLCQETLHLIHPIRARFPEVNIDAEGCLRTNDQLDRMKVQRYLRDAL